jgi:hypothetical protein
MNKKRKKDKTPSPAELKFLSYAVPAYVAIVLDKKEYKEPKNEHELSI